MSARPRPPDQQSRPPARTPVALTIAGSDSGGGAGIQADLKAFARCGVHGTSAITAITAQNTVGVQRVHALAPELVLAQVRSVLADMQVDAVKVGMLAGEELVHAVAQALDELPAGTPVVVDPVMVAESGARLLPEDAERALLREILPRATVLTPNLPEARALLAAAGRPRPGARDPAPEACGEEQEEEEARTLAHGLIALGPVTVVLTGGHRRRAVDLYLQRSPAAEIVEIDGPRHADGAAHGSGCTHSSLIAGALALGADQLTAARWARARAGEAVAGGLRDVGRGAGPVDVIGLRGVRARVAADGVPGGGGGRSAV